ncbi:hypothetical protein A3860_26480 [Niastella vici]|uniref:DUF2157 domain-containing protein n=1 Tax=Niastella vici TaxID=1703345 RepID=A0A1V9FWW9_9BACT|nr:hypothetical protein [Niastella vici]OQP62861.1 hypothetical protein A3860_26480 [Niastella vici]
MIAYNHTSLDNLLINEKAEAALHHTLISKEEAAAIKQTYPVNLYSPNIFIRIGLFLLTVVIILLGFGLFCLLILNGRETAFGVLALVTSLGTYGALEFLISEKKLYRSGIDDAMIWLSIAFMVTAVNLLFSSPSFLAQSVLVFILAAYFLLRFGNILMGGLAFIAFLSIVFNGAIKLGDSAKTAMPFLLMAISISVYWLVRKYKNDNRLRYYKACCTFVEILALLTLYIAGNYFAVREVSNLLFELNLKEGESIPAGWFFWIWTALLPLVYIFRGIQKRDGIILRTGLILVAAIVFTVRYYHHIAPIEIAMSIGGLIMILVAYGITKYLTPSKHGFTHAEPNDPQLAGLLQVESLVVAQTFQTTPAAPDKHFDFGEGSTGGGGATGSY